ncbi:catalase family protein [Pseudomonas sp. NA-150]|uniref:catalase family protein n=1 Tax=Pseudomonas sp. NA-150 TaxID=3367525 RepID=UPI0037C9140D
MILKGVHAVLLFLLHVERRFEPFFRPALNRLLREPSATLLQFFYNIGRKNEGLGLAQEQFDPDEHASQQSMIDTMRTHLAQDFRPGDMQRAGNTKTHGLMKATFTVHDNLPGHLRKGVFAEPRTYRCYVRFSGPGPHIEADIDDPGFISIGVKLLGVPGPKLMEDEHFTQDFTGVCTPTFVTPNTRSNAKLQKWSKRHMPLFYFFDPSGPTGTHVLDLLMQSLWNETQYNPLGHIFYSCVPYLLGEGQAMQYSFKSITEVYREIPRVPLRPPDNYLRDNMVKTLAEKDVEFHMQVQVQTDPHRMPIEDAGVLWPTRLSPRIPVATLHIPRQTFDSPQQLAFARNLTLNPWHCVPEHRPLGNQSRARGRMYYELARFRLQQNNEAHIEPTGDEMFD